MEPAELLDLAAAAPADSAARILYAAAAFNAATRTPLVLVGGAAQVTHLQCLDQIGFHDDGAAGHVDEYGTGFHSVQLRRGDHAVGQRRQRHTENQDVRLLEQVVQTVGRP